MTRNVICLFVALVAPLLSQTAGSGNLTGTVRDSSGNVIANATVTATNAATGAARTATSGADGIYKFEALPPGGYQLKIEAAGFTAVEVPSVIVNPTGTVVPDQKLEAAAPSLKDLFPADQTQGNAQAQAALDKRSHMLKIHQRLGLITTAPLIATLITSGGAAGHNSSSGSRDLHAALGITTASLYITTASFAILAPKIPGTTTRGPIRLHKTLAWIHGPGMILTPILGAMALDQRNRGEKVHGIAQAHSAVAVITGAAYGLAILSVSIKF